MTLHKDNRLAWGLTLLIFGILFLIKQLHIIPIEISEIIFDIKNYPLLVGLIFLFTHKNKNIAIVLIIVSLLLRLSDIIRWTQDISNFIWPILLIGAGLVLLIRIKK